MIRKVFDPGRVFCLDLVPSRIRHDARRIHTGAGSGYVAEAADLVSLEFDLRVDLFQAGLRLGTAVYTSL